MKVSRWGGRLGWCCLLALIFLTSCRRENPSNFDSNLPPDTYITSAPAESTLAFYQVNLFWYGVDPDGLVDHYEYSVTDTSKLPGEDDPGFSGFFQTERTDSLFVLQADQPQILGHRFYIRAVDNEGKMDPSPAWTYFVANDFNFPSVVFERALGTWIDRSGQTRSVQMNSSNPLLATDTIGVGGSVDVAWSGFDLDPGGFIVGYEYRSNENLEFIGGTLADTTVQLSYAQPGGAGLANYFSGRDIVRVRGIDDAGAKTNPDSVRSFIVNFNPVVWIVDPNSLTPPVRNRVFTDNDTEIVWPSGTILADGFRSIRFKYTGFDDERDMSLDPGNPSGITGFSYRKLQNGGGQAFKALEGWQLFPDVSDFDDAQITAQLGSGEYDFLVRATDELGRNGQPDTVSLDVNYPPFFESVRYVIPGDTLEAELWVPGTTPGSQADTVTVTLTEQPGGGYAPLTIRYQGIDDHFPSPDTSPLDVSLVVEEELRQVTEYLVRLNNSSGIFEPAPLAAPGEKTYPVALTGGGGIIVPGLNTLELVARDIGRKVTGLNVVFDVVLE